MEKKKEKGKGRQLSANDAMLNVFASQSFPFFPSISILARSKVLIKDDAGGWSLIDDGYIVHGGDACDKGRYADESHSIRLTATIEILRTQIRHTFSVLLTVRYKLALSVWICWNFCGQTALATSHSLSC